MTYAVRLSDRARDEAIAAAARQAEIAGDGDRARTWLHGLDVAIGTLAEYPRRYVILERETRLLGREMRRLLYRPTPHSTAAYHAYYIIADAGEDGPRVTVVHVRYASRRGLSAREARELRDDIQE